MVPLFIIELLKTVDIRIHNPNTPAASFHCLTVFDHGITVMHLGEHIVPAHLLQILDQMMVDNAGANKEGHCFQQSLGIDLVTFLIIISTKIADQFVILIKRHCHQTPDALPFQILIVERVFLLQHRNIREHDTGMSSRKLFPSLQIILIIQILQGIDFRRHPGCAPFKGIGCRDAVSFQNIKTVRMNHIREFLQNMTDTVFIVLATAQDL